MTHVVLCVWCAGSGYFYGWHGTDVIKSYRPCGSCSGSGIVYLPDGYETEAVS